MRVACPLSLLMAASMAVLAWAGPAGGHTTQASTTVPKTHVVYVAIGDSLTFGYGSDNPSTQSYPARLARHLPPGAGFRNLAMPAYAVADALKIELPQALAAHPTLATVWLGTVDVHNGVKVAAFKAGLDHLLSTLQRRHVRVFVATLPDFHLIPLVFVGHPPVCAGHCWIPGTAMNAAIVATAARHGDTVVDVYSATKSVWGQPSLVDSDGTHLTKAGYGAVAHLFYRVMRKQGAFGS